MLQTCLGCELLWAVMLLTEASIACAITPAEELVGSHGGLDKGISQRELMYDFEPPRTNACRNVSTARATNIHTNI